MRSIAEAYSISLLIAVNDPAGVQTTLQAQIGQIANLANEFFNGIRPKAELIVAKVFRAANEPKRTKQCHIIRIALHDNSV